MKSLLQYNKHAMLKTRLQLAYATKWTKTFTVPRN